jgi:hypothetical protein
MIALADDEETEQQIREGGGCNQQPTIHGIVAAKSRSG